MKEKLMKTMSLYVILLIIMLPISISQTSDAQSAPTVPALDVTIPKFVNSYKFDVSGVTAPLANVEIFVNRAVASVVQADSSGQFESKEIRLARDNNNVIVKSTDSSNRVAEKNFSVSVDVTPPIVILNKQEFVTTPVVNITGTINEPGIVYYRLANTSEFTFIEISKAFSIELQLEAEENKIEFYVEDIAGNKATEHFSIWYDTTPPIFEQDNLQDIATSYDPKVTIRGKLNEPGSVTVYVNDATTPLKVEVTDEQGNFRIGNVPLTRENKIDWKAKGMTAETKIAYENTIKLVAMDRAGRTTEKTGTIHYAFCGSGVWFRTMFEAPTPSVLTPRLLMRGFEQVIIPFNITYVGGGDINFNPRRIRIRPVQLSPEFEKDYDNGLLQGSPTIHFVKTSPTSATGVIQVKFGILDPLAGINSSFNAREYNVSQHRAGECFGYFGDISINSENIIGCMKLFLEMEIPFEEKISGITGPGGVAISPELRPHTQKECLSNIELQIDTVAPIDAINDHWLNQSVQFLDKVVDGIDKVLDPLTTIGTYLTYSCLGGTAVYFLAELSEQFTCKVLSLLSIAGDQWDSDFAYAGVCKEVYRSEFDSVKEGGKKKNPGRRTACTNCQNLVSVSRGAKEAMQMICDRVNCPSAPTLQSYIRSKKGAVEDITNKINTYYTKMKSPGTVTDKITNKKMLVKNKVYLGSDCGVSKLISTQYTAPGDVYGIKELYDITQKTGSKTKFCNEWVRPANPMCCGIEYVKEWNSACGVGGLPIVGEGLDTFSEIKESTCLAAQQAGRSKDMNCNPLWNSVAGFCEPDSGEIRSKVVYTGLHWDPSLKDAENNAVYIFVKPRKVKNTGSLDYRIYRGFSVKSAQHKTLTDSEKSKTDQLTAVNFEYREKEITQYFDPENKKTIPALKAALCSGVVSRECTTEKIERIYEEVISYVSTGEQEYIVIPESGILRSIQCICIPAVISWLEQWKAMANALKNCFATILLTGGGSEGMCEGELSRRVCDLLYDVISCAVNKFGKPGIGSRATHGIGNIFGSIVGAASEVSQNVKGRYGNSAMWDVMFNQKKLMHGVCAWAFTGTFKIDDFNAMFKESINEIVAGTVEGFSINSTGLVREATRRFRGYLPDTKPSGLTTWIYDFEALLIAGSDINYKVELICSESMDCRPEDGFKNGECDCFRSSEKRSTIDLTAEGATGQLEKNEMLNIHPQFVISANSAKSSVRYDRLELTWDWTDTKTNEKKSGSAKTYIRQAGGDAFAFCGMDLATLAFTCNTGFAPGRFWIKKANPVYNYQTKLNEAVFKYNDEFNFDIEVFQELPDDRDKISSAKKFLYYTLYDHSGNIVKETKPDSLDPSRYSDIFESNGDYVKHITINLADSLIQKHLEQSKGAALQGWMKSEDMSSGKKINANTYIQDYVSYEYMKIQKDGKNIPVIIVLEKDTYSIYELRSPTITSTGFGEGKEIIKNANYPSAVPGEVIQSNIHTIEGTRTINYNVRFFINKKSDGERAEIYVPVQQSAKLAPFTTGIPARWKIVFTAYDADKFGEVSSQITTESGNEQKSEVNFKVIGDVEDTVKKEIDLGAKYLTTFSVNGENIGALVNENVTFEGSIRPLINKNEVEKIETCLTDESGTPKCTSIASKNIQWSSMINGVTFNSLQQIDKKGTYSATFKADLNETSITHTPAVNIVVKE